MKKNTNQTMPDFFVCQKWEEIEFGYGERPDGYTLHPSWDAHKSFLEDHEKLNRSFMNMIPPAEEISVPCGTPYEVKTNLLPSENMQKAQERGHGAWFHDNYPPGDTDGWMKMGGGGQGKI